MRPLLCALAGLALLRAADGGEDGGAPGGRSERLAGSAGGAGLEPAPGVLQPYDPRPPRRRWLWSTGA